MAVMTKFEQWSGFSGRLWKEGVNVRDFIQNNYTPYDGDESFLEGPTDSTNRLWGKLQELQKGGDEPKAECWIWRQKLSAVSQHMALGYIDENMKELEQVVGLQTDKPSETCIHAVRRNQDGGAGLRNVWLQT